MDKDEWLACGDPEQMLTDFWRISRISQRKCRLCSVALCRRLKPQFLAAESVQRALECAELFADGAATAPEREAAWQAALRSDAPSPILYAVAAYQTIGDVDHVRAHIADGSLFGYPDEEAAQCALFRCVFGNPFPSMTSDPAWLTSDVLAPGAGDVRVARLRRDADPRGRPPGRRLR